MVALVLLKPGEAVLGHHVAVNYGAAHTVKSVASIQKEVTLLCKLKYQILKLIAVADMMMSVVEERVLSKRYDRHMKCQDHL